MVICGGHDGPITHPHTGTVSGWIFQNSHPQESRPNATSLTVTEEALAVSVQYSNHVSLLGKDAQHAALQLSGVTPTPPGGAD